MRTMMIMGTHLAVTNGRKGGMRLTVSTPYDERFSIFIPFAVGDLGV